MIVFRIYHSA